MTAREVPGDEQQPERDGKVLPHPAAAARQEDEEPLEAGPAPERSAQRRRARGTVMTLIGQLPHFARLLWGLFRDPRVSRLDKGLAIAAFAYVLIPLDMIPDVIPFLGQVDDIFVVVVALERLISNAGQRVVRSHWTGDPGTLSRVNLRRAVMAASLLLPRRMRRRLRRIAGGER